MLEIDHREVGRGLSTWNVLKRIRPDWIGQKIVNPQVKFAFAHIGLPRTDVPRTHSLSCRARTINHRSARNGALHRRAARYLCRRGQDYARNIWLKFVRAEVAGRREVDAGSGFARCPSRFLKNVTTTILASTERIANGRKSCFNGDKNREESPCARVALPSSANCTNRW